MSAERKTWDNLKAEYLRQVEKSLSSVRHPHLNDVLEDVSHHLDHRFSEIEPDRRTRETLKSIIKEMGPAQDYAELIAPETVVPKKSHSKKYLVWISLAVLIAIGAIFLTMRSSRQEGYIISFKPVAPFAPRTAKELLEAVNEDVRFRVTTHHFRTEVQGNRLIGSICTDTQADKDAIARILGKSTKLTLLGIQEASSNDLAKHYAKDQPSLDD